MSDLVAPYTNHPEARYDDLLPVYSRAELTLEAWRIVRVGETLYPRYAVSDLGRVRSLMTGRLLKPMWVRSSHELGGVYWRVGLSMPGRPWTRYMLHRLVAEAFVPGRTPERDVVHHRDHCTTNPRAANLEWCTQAFNIRQWYEARQDAEFWRGQGVELSGDGASPDPHQEIPPPIL